MAFIVNQPVPTPLPFTEGGWTRPELIEIADKRTERRGSKVLDLDSEFILCLQEFCLEHRWYWRRRTAWITMAPNQSIYDLDDPINGNAGDFYQFLEHGVILYKGDGTKAELIPEHDHKNQLLMLDDPDTGVPSRYFIYPGDVLQVVFWPIPDAAYSVRIGYWGVPVFTPADQTSVVPMVPPNMQHVLLKKLEAQIFRFTLGETTAKYQATMAEYDKLVERYALHREPTPGKVILYADQYAEDSVRST